MKKKWLSRLTPITSPKLRPLEFERLQIGMQLSHQSAFLARLQGLTRNYSEKCLVDNADARRGSLFWGKGHRGQFLIETVRQDGSLLSGSHYSGLPVAHHAAHIAGV
jgi:hypothetical protein